MTLDLAMPGLDGIGVLRALKESGAPAVPVIVVSAFSPAHGARAVDALAEGAFDLVPKPAVGEPLPHLHREPRRAPAPGGRRRRRPRRCAGHGAPTATPCAAPARRRARRRRRRRAVVIAASTGGPRALAQLLPALPGRLGAGTLIVQHMPAGFTGSLAARLDRMSRLHVREAAARRPARARHRARSPRAAATCASTATRHARLTDEAPVGGLRPRADLTIADVAAVWGERTLLVVLTGMGRDGARGRPRRARRRRARPLRGRRDLHRLRHAARGRRGRPGRRRPAAGRAGRGRSPRRPGA